MDTITHNMPASDKIALLRLMQLVSPALPIGAYCYSQGLEYAVQADWVKDEATGQNWILGILEHSIGVLDLPIFARLYKAWQARDLDKVRFWNDYLHACRESAEIQTEDCQLGFALARLLSDMGIEDAEKWKSDTQTRLVTVFALAAVTWEIQLENAAMGYLWSWTENQVLAAIKLIPLGQTSGQHILFHAGNLIPDIVRQGLSLEDDQIGNLMPAMAIGSALHETQYSRLFRS